MALTVIGAPGSSNSNVFLRMNAPDVTAFPNAGGTVNCAWGVGPEELFEVTIPVGGTTTTIESLAFPNRFLRVDAPAGVVNCQFTANLWEQFNLQPQSGGMAIQSNHWPDYYLSMDGTGVTSTSTPGGSVSVGSSGGANQTFVLYTDLAIGSQEYPGVYLRLDGNPGGVVNCQFGVDSWEEYHLEAQGNGTVAIKSKTFGVYLQLDGTGLDASTAGQPGGTVFSGSTPGYNATFQIVRLSDGSVAIASVQFPGVYLGMNGAGVTEPTGPGGGSVYAVYYGDASSAGADAKFLIQPQSAANQYVGPISAFYGSLYSKASSYQPVLDDALVTEIQGSGFTTVILGLFHIAGEPATPPPPASHLLGDIVFNQGPAVASGGTIQTSVVGADPADDWAHYLNALKSSGSVNKIYLSFGGGGVEDFTVIVSSFLKYLDPTTSTGPYIPCDSVLYKNFQALRTYLPMADGIDIDQEEGSDQSYIDAMTAFGIMARSVGFSEITYAPPFDSSLGSYQSAAQSINAFALRSASLTIGGTDYPYSGLAYPASPPPSLAGFSTRMGLQYYSGGYDPSGMPSWETAVAAIEASGGGNAPLLLIGASGWQTSSPADMLSFFQGFPSPAWAGGFIWDFNAITANLTGFQQAIQTGVTASAVQAGVMASV